MISVQNGYLENITQSSKNSTTRARSVLGLTTLTDNGRRTRLDLGFIFWSSDSGLSLTMCTLLCCCISQTKHIRDSVSCWSRGGNFLSISGRKTLETPFMNDPLVLNKKPHTDTRDLCDVV